jgi:hypothetical protein
MQIIYDLTSGSGGGHVTRLHAQRYTPGRRPGERMGHQRSLSVLRSRRSTSDGGASRQYLGGWSQFESPYPAATRSSGAANEAVITEDGPHPPAELGGVGASCEPRRSHRPCHLRAVRSGRERYVADSHGHLEKVAERAASAWPWEMKRPETAWHTRGQGFKSPQLHQAQRIGRTPAQGRLSANRQQITWSDG